MLLKGVHDFSREALMQRATGRFFERIDVVTSRPEELVENLIRLYGLEGWRSGSSAAGSRIRCFLENVELRLIKPAEGTPCAAYLDKFGEGLCCVRENVPAANWDAELARYEKLGVPVLWREAEAEGETLWLDTRDILGGFLAIHSGAVRKAEDIPGANQRHLCQINIVTDDVDRTAAELTALLEIGPWSIGTLNNQTVSNAELLVNGEMVTPEFHFQLGITFYSNIEFEIIQPVKGPTVYQAFLERHGVGFHHIKESVPAKQWQETLDAYTQKGMRYVIKGQVGPTCFAYLDSEQDFGFIVELGDGLAADPLPEGYNEYIYPEF